MGLFAWRGGWYAVRDELPVALLAGLLLYAVNVGRVTVTDTGVSFHTAGTRLDPDAVVPSALVREVRVGPAPEGWPAPRRRGGWWPGRTRVAVRHTAGDGEEAFTLWARDPEAFAEALGAPLTR
ncbi:hypothetical protein [Blastococcus sp. TF02A-35]|uniref:hypothetical protein n=1 Tax=Blastococcus sp. TF02A-35 TaxID=2559612 RepID=UPI00107386EA|nr:hypothetical protein [Blastococcus sp. TF02A_35]TFV52127.1 hypothetical protein E4P43_07775 [Blastococcus sp. TF02A_35]